MLKQDYFFKAIRKHKLSFNQYAMMYYLYTQPSPTREQLLAICKAVPPQFVTGYKLSEEGIKIIKELDKLFVSKKKLIDATSITPEFKANVRTYIEIFPQSILPSGKYARANEKNIELNMLWFFTEYDYPWELILQATRSYVLEYSQKSTPYEHMRTCMYFIKKEMHKQVISELADYCARTQEGFVAQEERIHKRKVV